MISVLHDKIDPSFVRDIPGRDIPGDPNDRVTPGA